MEQKSPVGSIRHSIFARAFRIFLPVGVICLCAAFVIFQSETDNTLSKLKAADQAAVKVGARSIENVLESVTRDLTFLAEHNGFNRLISIKKSDPQVLQGLVADWLLLSRTNKNYDQIRWLDQTGLEQVRINYNKGTPVVVEKSNLQNKGKRYYFVEAVKLNKGEFFISPLDLNMERGEIEHPLKPMIRIGTPVFDSSGQKKGILLVNYFGKKLLDDYRRVLGKVSDRAWLVNRDGYWLKGATPDEEWGFMYKNPKASMSYSYPNAWTRLLQGNKGQFENQSGLWTFDTVFPLREGHKTSKGSHDAFTPSLSELEKGEYFWKAVLLLPEGEFHASEWQTGLSLGTAALVLLVGVFFGCWRLATAWIGEEKKEEELRQLNLGLEQTVEERTKELRDEIQVRKKIETTLRERGDRFRSITNTSSVAIIVTVDQAGDIVTWNPAAVKAFGYSENEAIGMSLINIMPERYHKGHQKGLQHAVAQAELKSSDNLSELYGLRRNGDEFPIELSLGTWVQSGVRYFSAVLLDITERKVTEQKLKHLATHDTLTGLPTRVICIDHIEAAISASLRNKNKMAVFFLDLDGFKAVNDTMGHDAGDTLLISVADRLSSCVRDMDTVARIGGDEFVVVLGDINEIEDVEQIAKKFVNSLSQPFILGKKNVATIGVSIGISMYPDHAYVPSDLIKLADEAMYDVKNDGKNGYVFSKPRK